MVLKVTPPRVERIVIAMVKPGSGAEAARCRGLAAVDVRYENLGDVVVLVWLAGTIAAGCILKRSLHPSTGKVDDTKTQKKS